jgi:hypothetical protein
MRNVRNEGIARFYKEEWERGGGRGEVGEGRWERGGGRGEVRGGEVRGGEVRGGEVRGGEVRGGEVRGGEVRGGEVRGGRGGRREERGVEGCYVSTNGWSCARAWAPRPLPPLAARKTCARRNASSYGTLPSATPPLQATQTQ